MIKKLATVGILALFVLATASCQKLQARDNLNKGIKAFKEGRYEDAVKYFDDASKLDPELTNAELYLATSYAQQFVPGLPGEENEKYANDAIRTFEIVVEKDPKNTSAIAGLAGIYQGLKNFDKSREYYKKQTEVEPDNAVPYYAIGSTDWMMMRDRDHPIAEDDKPPLIEEGLQYIDKALEKDPNYQDALAYKNLLLRDKAAITKDPEEAKRLLDEADVYFNKALEALKKNAEKNAVGADAEK
jgi:tetratricopeptide (TPR) repeat protein